MRRRLWTAALAIGVTSAATVVVGVQPAYAVNPGSVVMIGSRLVFTAGDGTSNDVMFDLKPDGDAWMVDVIDVAPVVANEPCDQVTEHRASCAGVTLIIANGEDMNDKLGVRETGVEYLALSATALDVIFHGGSGSDLLEGGAGDDKLDGGPDPDKMVGNGGTDTVTYEKRVVAVAADADGTPRDDGHLGEHDTIWGDVENLIGGAGADWLGGNASANILHGGPGADQLSGYAGGDLLYGDAGFDLIDGGADRDICYIGADGAQTSGCESVVS